MTVHTLLSHLAIALSFACQLSFGWAIWKVFVRVEEKKNWKRVVMTDLSAFMSLVYAVRIVMRAEQSATSLLAVGCVAYAMSLAVFHLALATNRKSPLSIAYSPDLPQHLARSGPYRFIRHPIYTSYIAWWLVTPVLGDALWLMPFTLLMTALFYDAASGEERKFASSELAAAYESYKNAAGMFLPRVFPRAH